MSWFEAFVMIGVGLGVVGLFVVSLQIQGLAHMLIPIAGNLAYLRSIAEQRAKKPIP